MKCKDKSCLKCYPDKELGGVINRMSKNDAIILLTRITSPVQHKIVGVIDCMKKPSKHKTTLDEVNIDVCKLLSYLQIRSLGKK